MLTLIILTVFLDNDLWQISRKLGNDYYVLLRLIHHKTVKYYEELIKIDIENIKNNIEKFKIYENVLEIFKLNKCNMIIKYCDKEYLVYNEIDLKRIFKSL